MTASIIPITRPREEFAETAGESYTKMALSKKKSFTCWLIIVRDVGITDPGEKQ